MTPEEKVECDQHTEWAAWMEDGIAQLRAGLEEEADPKTRRWREKIIKDIEAKVQETREKMPDWTSRPD